MPYRDASDINRGINDGACQVAKCTAHNKKRVIAQSWGNHSIWTAGADSHACRTGYFFGFRFCTSARAHLCLCDADCPRHPAVQLNGRKALGACPRIRRGRVPGAEGADARRRDAGDVVTSSRSANAADTPRRPEPKGRMGIARRSLRCSSSTMSPHRLLLAPCAPRASPIRAALCTSTTGC